MAEIKGLALLEGKLTEKQLQQIEAGALLMRRHTSITFKIKYIEEGTEVKNSGTDNEIVLPVRQATIQAVQDRIAAGGEYLDRLELIKRTKAFFEPFLPGWEIIVHAIPYQQSPAAEVDPEWISQKMESAGLKLKDVVAELGLDRTNVTAWVSGSRPMSQPVKSMFYYYFAWKGVA